jgi:hypothetical protein
MRLPGQDMHLLHPLDSSSVKSFTSMQTLSLMTVFRVAVGPAMALMPESERFLTDPDTGRSKRELSKLYHEQLRSLANLRDYSGRLQLEIDRFWAIELPLNTDALEVGLSSWIFDTVSYAMGAVFWGKRGPFEDAAFRDQLRCVNRSRAKYRDIEQTVLTRHRVFIQNLEPLRNPIPFLIPSRLRSARDLVRQRLHNAAREETYGAEDEEPTLFMRLATLYEAHGVSPRAYTDCHLVAIVGLLSNVINIMVWAMSHILADEDLMKSLRKQLEAVAVKEALTKNGEVNLRLDLDKIRDSCPLLFATWYELLRTYGDSPVARYVHQDSAFDARYQVKKGSIIMTPIHLHNFDEGVWGPEAEAFDPSRFLLKDTGKVDPALVKHLEVFGLPGMHQCPGRYLAMNLFLGFVTKALLSFEWAPAGAALEVPNRKETMLGLPATQSDARVFIRRRPCIRAVHVGSENVRPGW